MRAPSSAPYFLIYSLSPQTQMVSDHCYCIPNPSSSSWLNADKGIGRSPWRRLMIEQVLGVKEAEYEGVVDIALDDLGIGDREERNTIFSLQVP